jgi:hypothetical protein
MSLSMNPNHLGRMQPQQGFKYDKMGFAPLNVAPFPTNAAAPVSTMIRATPALPAPTPAVFAMMPPATPGAEEPVLISTQPNDTQVTTI